MKRLKRKKRITLISYDIEKELRGFSMTKKAVLKMVLVLLILGINWLGISSVGRTIAYFNDIEQSLGNIYKAGTLDFSLVSSGDFSLNITPSASVLRQAKILNQGTLPFQYIIEPTNLKGDLCGNLNLEAKLNDEVKYSGKLTDFVLNPAIIYGEPANWQFLISFEGDGYKYNKKACQFSFGFMGWQDNMTNYALSGFDDIEKLLTRVTLHLDKTVVLNEILSDPFGDDCSLTGIEGEWVELYNNSDIIMDLDGWYIKDTADHKIIISSSNTLSGSTNILPKGWLVVFLDGCILNNDSDSVKLYHSAGIELVDSYSYFEPKPEGSSFARIPDGIGAWFDPIPTPGAPNKLEILTEPEIEIETKPIIDLFSIRPLLETLELKDVLVEEVLETTTPQDEKIFEIEAEEVEEIEEIKLPESVIETTTPQDEKIFEIEAEEIEEIEEIELPEPVIETASPAKEETILIEPNNDEQNNEEENQ